MAAYKSDAFRPDVNIPVLTCGGSVKLTEPKGANFVVKSRLKPHQAPNSIVRFMAASPADRMTTFAGSGLPFPNPEIAYEGSPNVGAVQAVNGAFEFRLHFPNSFYVNGGTKLLPPHVLVKVCSADSGGNESETDAILLGAGIPNRFLTNAPGTYTRSSFKPTEWDDDQIKKLGPSVAPGDTGTPWFTRE